MNEEPKYSNLHSQNLKNRRGTFKISFPSFEEPFFDDTHFVLRQFAVVHANSRYDRQEIEYVAYSEMFDVVPPGEKAPEYIIVTEKNRDGNIVKVSAQRTEYDGFELSFGLSTGKTTVPLWALLHAYREWQKKEGIRKT